ncbi:MAG: AraC family transcriptional regulator [Verrucomicrobiota bacterium]
MSHTPIPRSASGSGGQLNFTWLRSGPAGQPDWPLPREGVLWLLNFEGESVLTWRDGSRRQVRPGSMCCLRPAAGKGLASAARLPGSDHDCLVLFFPDHWLNENLQTLRPDLPADFRVVLLGPAPLLPMVSRPLDPADKVWANGLLAPHLCEAARVILTKARMTDFLLQKVFTPPPAEREMFCTRTKWLAIGRVEKVKAALLQSLDEPPTLDALAAIAGVNPHHLSRTFTQVEGITLTAWLRRQRIEQAAVLLASGRCNVSEAALEVGYQSLSHFSRAFMEEKGVPPSRWTSHSASAAG